VLQPHILGHIAHARTLAQRGFFRQQFRQIHARVGFFMLHVGRNGPHYAGGQYAETAIGGRLRLCWPRRFLLGRLLLRENRSGENGRQQHRGQQPSYLATNGHGNGSVEK
jgi:hypothetical protein